MSQNLSNNAAAAMAAAGNRPNNMANVPEEELWSGSPSMRQSSIYIVVAIVLLLIVELICSMTLGWEWFLPRVIVYGLIIASISIRELISKKSNRYRVTNKYIYSTRGLLNIRTDQIFLPRLRDITVQQKLLDRMVGVGDVHIASTDMTDGQLTLKTIENPNEVASMIRGAWEKVRGTLVDVE